MPRGRKPKPTILKILAGNPGCRPLNLREPQPSRELPLCPDWLDDEAKREWNGIVPELHRMGLLTVVDRAALAGYCQAFADLRDAVETLRTDGKTITTANGNLLPHPAVSQKNRSMLTLAKFLSEFGLSPASRVKLKSPDQSPRDDFEEFMQSG